MTRRRWLRHSLGLAAVALAAPEAAPTDPDWHERRLIGFGTSLWLRVGHEDGALARSALDAAVASIRHVESLMSLFDPRSQLSRLNREGELRAPHPDLVALLRLARSVSQQSDGAFDVTMQPLWRAWDRAARDGALPAAGEIDAARTRVDWRALEVADDRLRLLKPGMAVSLNGIAQGFAADLARERMAGLGIRRALLDTGEWSPLGAGPRGQPWTLGVGDPHAVDALLARVRLDGRALATSSDERAPFSADRRHHPIVDPRTGYSPPGLSLVAVLAPSCALADALTKVFFVAGPGRVADLARQWGVDVLAVDKSGRRQVTGGLPLV